jgi:hypothetical protein
MNMHGDHVATCLCCKWLDMGYEGDWSEVTPGRGWYCDCRKRHFYGLDESELHMLHEYAPNCPDFLPKEQEA